MNSWLRELVAVATVLGVPIDPDNDEQVLAGIQRLIDRSAHSNYAIGSGDANVYRAAYVPRITALVSGQILRFKAKDANSGASTFAPDGLTARPLLGNDYGELRAGDIAAGSICWVQWDGTANNGNGAWILVVSSGIAVPTASTIISGISRRATSAEAQAFLRDDVTVSPASLRAAFQGGNYSATFNGYDVMPGGMIRNWGIVPLVVVPANSFLDASVTFANAFLANCLSLQLTVETSAPTQVSASVKPDSLTKTGFTVVRGNSSSATPWGVVVRYEAYGR
ncbi:hypothetical protein [Achromobacter sp. 2789STDY5608621]|uniref:gp53-like domain-containing protein n=1 Tax=Achromobacter sp. 2789STDY5608621 TaxID=1806496 RepID=UPI0012E1AF16|nr:hypothetical protein [Achromobacter sp. 2789STDY5608621]